jgi:putative copper export protein
MLTVNAATIRIFLHVLGATVWIGGQIVLAGVVPVVRKNAGADTLRAVARRFQWLAWPAYVLLVVTGVWNLTAVHAADQSSAYLTTLFVKLVLVGLSGAAAAGHIIVRQPAAKGLLASLSLLAALGAAFLGVLLGVGG